MKKISKKDTLRHCQQVLDNRNPVWDAQKKQNKVSFSLSTVFGLAGVAPTGTCFPWRCCAARPQRRTEGCPLHTHDLRDSQPTDGKELRPHPQHNRKHPHTSPKKDLDVSPPINLAVTRDTKSQRARRVSYRAIKECPQRGRRPYRVMRAWWWRCLQTSFLKTGV